LVRRAIFYNNLTELGIPVNLVRVEIPTFKSIQYMVFSFKNDFNVQQLKWSHVT